MTLCGAENVYNSPANIAAEQGRGMSGCISGAGHAPVWVWQWSSPLSHYIIMTRGTGHRRRGTTEHSVWPQLALGILQDEEDKP